MTHVVRPQRLGNIAVICLLAGCGGGGDFPTAPASGHVLCEGKPVPHVMVFFEPLQSGKSALVGKQGFGIADEKGQFVISTYGEKDGAVVGRHRVRVGPPRSGDHPGFRCACLVNPEVDVMEVDVQKGQKNDFEVVLRKRTASDPQPLKDD